MTGKGGRQVDTCRFKKTRKLHGQSSERFIIIGMGVGDLHPKEERNKRGEKSFRNRRDGDGPQK